MTSFFHLFPEESGPSATTGENYLFPSLTRERICNIWSACRKACQGTRDKDGNDKVKVETAL